MTHVACPERHQDRPSCCSQPERCAAEGVRPVPANPMSTCDVATVRCALEKGHDGQHMSEPIPCRSLLGRRRWLVGRW